MKPKPNTKIDWEVKLKQWETKLKEYINNLNNTQKIKVRTPLHYEKKFLEFAKKYNIGELETLNTTNNLTYDFIFNIFLSNIELHKEFISHFFPDKRYYANIKELMDDGFDIQYFFARKEQGNVKDTKSVCFKRKEDDKVFMGYVMPTVSINIEFEDYFFIDSSIYAYYYNTKTIDLNGSKESSISDLLKYMENNDISDLHFQLQDEYSYYFTARFGQEIIRITETPINKEYVDKIYNQALIKIGKDSLSSPPEVSGLLKERLLSEKGRLVDRTFRFHSMFDNKGQFQGRAVSIRRLMNYEEISSLGLSGLNYLDKAIELLDRAASNTHGIVFITGKTNSGKSTLLYCILAKMYDMGRRIKSIEAPIEVVAPFSQVDLTQTEDAEEKYKMTRKIAVSALLRQDPDVVLIQEVRTKEEVDEFIELGLKGHLAYSTMHTGSVQETILRAMKSAKDPKDLQIALKLVVTQELIGKKCQACNEDTTKKCTVCNGLGIKGVLPVYEIAYFNDVSKCDLTDISPLIKKGLVDYISKQDVIAEYYKNGLVLKKEYDRIMKYEKNLRD